LYRKDRKGSLSSKFKGSCWMPRKFRISFHFTGREMYHVSKPYLLSNWIYPTDLVGSSGYLFRLHNILFRSSILFCRNIEGLQILLTNLQHNLQSNIFILATSKDTLSMTCNWCLIAATLMEVVSLPKIEEESLMADKFLNNIYLVLFIRVE